MPRYKHILALDPSGNFDEGKGTTGWVLMNYKEKLLASGSIAAKDYQKKEDYYKAILDLIDRNHIRYHTNGFVVVIEDFVLYRDKATAQTNSKMETCRLIGIIQYHCWLDQINYSMQLATAVKHRWSDELLLHERILYEDRDGLHHTETKYWMNTPHVRDAFRHALHFCLCRNDKHQIKTTSKPDRFSNYGYVGEQRNYDAQSRNKGGQRETQTHFSTAGNFKGNRTRTRVWRA